MCIIGSKLNELYGKYKKMTYTLNMALIVTMNGNKLTGCVVAINARTVTVEIEYIVYKFWKNKQTCTTNKDMKIDEITEAHTLIEKIKTIVSTNNVANNDAASLINDLQVLLNITSTTTEEAEKGVKSLTETALAAIPDTIKAKNVDVAALYRVVPKTASDYAKEEVKVVKPSTNLSRLFRVVPKTASDYAKDNTDETVK
jgi:hypothetical protein